jgi:acetylornithine deacetylase/succinyl-diaminopimelate desuccinylase family protein
MADPINDQNMDDLLARIKDDEVIQFTQEFVRIESVNGNEKPAADFVAKACEGAGLQVTIEEVHDGRPNVLAVLPGESDELGILFHGHTDTVPFFDMVNPISGELQDDYIWGRGSVDQKGGLAAAIMAVVVLARAGFHPKKSIAIAAVIDEESEHRGSWALTQKDIQADFAITTEPSDLNLQVAHKGTAPMRVDFKGVLAHGSNPWVGVNAIEMAARFVLELKVLNLKSVEIPGVGVMQATYNVGLIEGGTQYNNVADTCSIFLDRRMVPGEDQSMILDEMQSVIHKLAAEDPKFEAQVSVARPDWKWEVIRRRGLNPSMSSPNSKVAQAISDAHKAETGQAVEVTYTHGYNDGDFLNNDLKIPTVNYGPGEGNRSHTIQEKLRIDHLLTATRVYMRTILSLNG